MFRILGVDDLPARVSIYDRAVDIVFPENKTGEITLNVYLISMTDILSTWSNHGKGALLIISGCVLQIIWERNCFNLFNSHSKDGEGNISQNGTVVLLKFDTFSNLEEYIKQIYYNGNNNETLYFQIQFINVVCTHEMKQHIKGKLKSSRNWFCQKSKQRRISKNQVTENLQHLNPEIVKKKKTEILNDGGPESFKNHICQKRKQANTENPDKGHPQQINPENQKEKKTEVLLDDRVKCFTKQIWERPYYICIICHRSFYWCSVHYFSIENYNDFKMGYIPAATFDNTFW